MRKTITRDEILRHFRVDVDSGRIWWASAAPYYAKYLGKEAGTPSESRRGKIYWIVRVNGQRWSRARLIFCVAHGRLPTPCVDHISGDSLDDRIANLREATVLQNTWNHKGRQRRIPLPMGVRIQSNRFAARIGYMGRQIQIGTFDSPAEAEAAYRAKRQELFGEFA